MNYHKLVLPFEKYHKPNSSKLPEEDRELVEELNKEILDEKYRFLPSKCLCGSEDFDIIATVDKYSVLVPTVMCKNCGLIQTNPKFSDTFYKELYDKKIFKNLYYTGPDIEHFVLERMNINTGWHIFKAIDKHKNISSETKIVEIGAGAGWNLIPFIDKGAQVIGFEPDLEMVEIAKKYNMPIIQGDETNLVGQYDIIILDHDLEHMTRPVLKLLKISEHLKDNGIIYIGVPYLLKFDLTTLALPNIYYFTPYSLKYYASEANLLPLTIEITSKNSFYGIFKKGFYHNQDLLKINIKKTKEIISKRFWHETLTFSKKIKSIDDVPGKIFFTKTD